MALLVLATLVCHWRLNFQRTQQNSKNIESTNRRVLGFDINSNRILELNEGFDRTNEISSESLAVLNNLKFTNDTADLHRCDVFIVTVPTPIDNANRPDLLPLIQASKLVGVAIKERYQQLSSTKAYTTPVIVFESTVYPGATEEVCVPILEKYSDLKANIDFVFGYSPERINPGDKINNLVNIKKVTSASTENAAVWVDSLYNSIIHAGTYKAASIKVAEAAKVIENTQRDLNIALINELAIIFSKMNIDTLDVLEAAETKWNFLSFRPGLVGGHCIGVDPYYLTYKAQQLGYDPQVVLAGRRINDRMGEWVVEQIIAELCRRRFIIGGAKILILGLTFKENCPDLRNTRVVDIINSFNKFDVFPEIVEPLVDPSFVFENHGLLAKQTLPKCSDYSAVIIAVAHDCFFTYI